MEAYALKGSGVCLPYDPKTRQSSTGKWVLLESGGRTILVIDDNRAELDHKTIFQLGVGILKLRNALALGGGSWSRKFMKVYSGTKKWEFTNYSMHLGTVADTALYDELRRMISDGEENEKL